MLEILIPLLFCLAALYVLGFCYWIEQVFLHINAGLYKAAAVISIMPLIYLLACLAVMSQFWEILK